MKLSIIIPVYNVVNYLEETVNSILNQIYRDYEIILVDDGSTDGSRELCDNLSFKDSRIVVIHQKNSGVSVARNTGVAAAKGEYIGFVDSDDLIEPDMYSVLFDVAEKNVADIVQCRHNRNSYIENSPREIDVEIKCGTQFVKDIFKHSGGEYTNQVALWSKIYKRELFDGIVFPIGQTYEDEQETYKICLKAKKIALISDELYHYVKRDNSIITGVSPQKMLDKQLALKDRVNYLPDKIPELGWICVNSFYNYTSGILVELYFKDKSFYKKAKRNLKEEYYKIKEHLNKYQKIYYLWLHISFLEKILMKYNYEPIQKFIKGIRKM